MSEDLLRHLLATLVYRGRNVLSDLPTEVVDYRAHADVRTPLEILAHVNELLDYTIPAFVGAAGRTRQHQ